EASGLGPDLQPVPEPTVRDHSVPQPGTRRPAPPEPADTANPPVPPAEPDAVEEPQEVVVSADEMAPGPASAEEILGRPDAAGAEGAPPAPGVSLTSKPRPRKKPLSVAAAPAIGNYRLPPLDLLQPADLTVKPTETREELMANARLLQLTLAQFGIEVSLGDITKGPTITRYELHPAPGVKLERITALTNNIAAALKAERIHILAPVPGRSSVGVEVPNLIKTKVIMRDLLESDEWSRTKARIPLCLGKDVYGHPIIADLAEMPHVLIAGSTGSGKSVCINGIIASLLYKFPPDQLRFVMIDPKVVEMQQYNTLPHLVVPVVTDPKKVVLALRWVVNEMEKRYQIFAKVGVRNIKSFNERPKSPPPRPAQPELPLPGAREKIEATREGFAVQLDEEIVDEPQEEIVIPDRLSYIVVIIDELADLMLVAPADVEMAIARITQMARAAGIHCIVATQRPSVDVITGVIKSNIPARIAFQVASAVDSRTILDQKGADKLLGKGDMLYLPPGSAKLNRAQGALITDQEIQSIVDFIAVQGKPSYELEIHRQLSKPARDSGEDGAEEEDEDLIEQCIEVIRSEQKASTSLLQRRLGLGYGRAARMMDVLEDRGIVGPANGAKPRDVLLDLEGTGADGGKQQLV
ncbi:MAG TPA: DNA translocase FtsK, partial [Verrucomicrobiota bacterium]|nr:DNA translocase FtsK [Verrucomicrobiota bacterium]